MACWASQCLTQNFILWTDMSTARVLLLLSAALSCLSFPTASRAPQPKGFKHIRGGKITPASRVYRDMPREKPPALMRRVQSILQKHPGLTESQVASKVGKGQPYVSKLRLIGGLDESVVAEWEASWNGGIHVPVNVMRDLHTVPRHQQRAEYRKRFARAELTKRHHREKLRQTRRRG